MAAYPRNGIVHLDITGPDSQQLEAFYREVLDWDVEAKGPGYALVHTPADGPDAAITEAQTATVVFGVAVDDIAQSLVAAISAGGTEIMPVTDNGWVTKAQMADPAGNIITLIQR